MKIIRYEDAAGHVLYGQIKTDGSAEKLTGSFPHELSPTGEPADVRRMLSPIVPTQILAIGLNYRDHANETGAKEPAFPVLFMKNTAALQHPGSPIALPTHLKSNEVDYEGELAVVIGKDCKNVSRADALSYVLGYTIANDVSARDWQKQFGGGQFCRGKSFDTFCPLGPCLVTADEIPDPQTLAVTTKVNGETRQAGSTADMIFPVDRLIEFLSGSTTLLAGTVIITGTPAGVGMAMKPPRWLKPGDEVSITIDRIGTLTNRVILEK